MPNTSSKERINIHGKHRRHFQNPGYSEPHMLNTQGKCSQHGSFPVIKIITPSLHEL